MQASIDGQEAVRIGGEIKTPTKIRDVRPVYPPEAMATGVAGMVIVEALIDMEGAVRSTRVLRSIPQLDQAALDAVRQWRFTPTVLNGLAVPVIMTVTVNFTLQ
jgi:protein TonB